MKILFLTQYFPPETGAAQNRLYDLACRLAALGHLVTVLTSLPSYPRGEIYEGYRGCLVKREDDEGIRIVRTWAYASKKKSFLPRIFSYLSFSILSFVAGLFAVEGADVIYTESPPLFLGISGYLLSKLKRAKFILNISDLWPESAVAVGMLHSKPLIRWATRIEEGLYRRASFVTGQTQGIIDSIHERCPETPIALLTNGVAPEFIQRTDECRQKREYLRVELGIKGKFVAGYAGLHGLVYGLDAVLDVSQALAEIPEIAFLLVGDGPEKPRLQHRVQDQGIGNVFFRPSQPAARMPEILAAMDVVLITLRRHDLFKGTLPSKLFEAMGAGIPVVAAMEGEARSLIERANCGICVEPENVAGIAEAIMRLYRDPALRKTLGTNGRNYVATHYDRKEIAKKLEQILFVITSPVGAVPSDKPSALTGKESHARRLELTGVKHAKIGD